MYTYTLNVLFLDYLDYRVLTPTHVPSAGMRWTAAANGLHPRLRLASTACITACIHGLHHSLHHGLHHGLHPRLASQLASRLASTACIHGLHQVLMCTSNDALTLLIRRHNVISFRIKCVQETTLCTVHIHTATATHNQLPLPLRATTADVNLAAPKDAGCGWRHGASASGAAACQGWKRACRLYVYSIRYNTNSSTGPP